MSVHRKKIFLFVAAVFGIGLAMLMDRWGQEMAARASSDGNPGDGPVPKRIAVFSVAAVEILFALDAGDHIAGATRFATYPPAADRLLKLGGIMDINFERLTAIKPDLVLAQSGSARLEAFAANRHIPFQRLHIEQIKDVYDTVAMLGKTMGRVDAAAALVRRMKADLASIEARTAPLEKIPCFISIDRRPGEMAQLLSPGGDTFISELLALAGGDNIFADIETGYPTVSKESLMARAPRVILEMKPDEHDKAIHRKLISDWAVLPAVPAVAEGRIAVVSHPAGLLPSLRMADVAREMARVLHPNAFPLGETVPDGR